MLHAFFFLLSFVMDYRTLVDAIQNSSLMGLSNAGILCLAVICVSVREWLAHRRGGSRVGTGAKEYR
jgi:hypothetical protein